MRVLITSGGGAKGAFSVGALQYLFSQGISRFDLISGTSTGSLIANMAGIGNLATLADVYLNTKNEDVLKPLNLVESIQAGRPYVYSSEPLMKQITTHVTPAIFNQIKQGSTKLCFNSVCLQTGRLAVFSTHNISSSLTYDSVVINDYDTMIKAIIASANQPVFMQPVEINGRHYVDGGNREVVPTRMVIDNLDNAANNDIYILSNNPSDMKVVDKAFGDILSVLMRSISIFVQEVRENDLEVLKAYKRLFPNKTRIFYISPTDDLDPEFSTGLRFDKLRMQQWMGKGESMAKKILKDFPNGNL